MQRHFERARHGRVRLLAVLCAASAFGFAFPSEAIAAGNTMQIVVGNGPFAGKYSMNDRVGSHLVNCFSTGGKIEAAYKFARKIADAKQFEVADSKTMSGAAVVVDNPTDSHAKTGDLTVQFGNRRKDFTEYFAFAPEGTVTLVVTGAGREFVFKGRTKDGIALEATASCNTIEKI